MICFSFYSSLSLREKNGGKKNLFISNYHRSDVAFMLRVSMRVFLRQLARHLMLVRLFLRSLDNPIYRSIGKRSGISAAPSLHPPHLADLLQPFLRRIVGLYRLGLNDYRGVTFLPCFASGRHRSGDVARTQSQRNRHASYDGGSYRRYHLVNLLLCHNFSYLLLRRILSDNFWFIFGHFGLIPSNRPKGRSNSVTVCQSLDGLFILQSPELTAPAILPFWYSRRSSSSPCRTANLCRSCT